VIPKPLFSNRLALSEFIGTWNVRRSILDRNTGVTTRFVGTLLITARDFFEEGTTSVGQASFVSRRRYALDFNGDRLVVVFSDGRPFIQLAAVADQSVVHDCVDDIYAGRIVARDANHVAEIWRVTGPRKNYTSIAHFNRVTGRSNLAVGKPVLPD
jgi:hypothetical protein